ncbi:hypothetical protein SAMN04489724_0400 [Algoriphagus locisalis]|uniref:Uncharacterized protein n=1 Tax=Algoriphagus locisalis TaxID=305507 RepID=A0A1I6XD04_9BACT|nr:hypothetical protein SAMN04489724_0400 [Algoriphagus locisalis]
MVFLIEHVLVEIPLVFKIPDIQRYNGKLWKKLIEPCYYNFRKRIFLIRCSAFHDISKDMNKLGW